MRDLNMALCRVRQEEARFDRTCEQAQEIREAQLDQAIETVMDKIAQGEMDSDMANYFDAAMLMRIARIFSTYYRYTKDGKVCDFELAYAVTAEARLHIKNGIKDYAKDIAELNL